MRNEILEGEIAVQEILSEVRQLISEKEEYIRKEDIGLALLLHAITYVYQSSDDESEASHIIMNIVSAVLQGESNDQFMKDIIGTSYIKH